jgi:serine/threonine-protein kinase
MAVKGGAKPALKVGDILADRYKVVDLIGTGGTASVYLVNDMRLGVYRALKELIVTKTKRGKMQYRMVMYETQLLRKLSHPAVPKIMDIWEVEENSALYMLMEYVDGGSLYDHAKREFSEGRQISEESIKAWGIELCDVLRYLHENREPKVIYRDLKPQNVMLNGRGDIKLLDFGISREITPNYDMRNTTQLGSIGFAAPECTLEEGFWFDERSDIYALGRVLYYLATGHYPGDLSKPVVPIRRYNETRSVGLEKIINKATASDYRVRYQSVSEMLYDLENIDKLGVEYNRRMNFRFRSLIGLAVSSVVLFASGGIATFAQSKQEANTFSNLITVGVANKDSSKILDAIKLRPTELKGYYSLIDVYKVDGNFSNEEANEFSKVLLANLQDLRATKGYGDLAFDIGRLYWFYQGDGGAVQSITWFEDAVNFKASNDKVAKVYLELGKFKKDIVSSVAEASDAGMYKKYWGALTELYDLEVSNDMMKLTLVRTVYDTIDIYGYQLKNDGVSKDDITGLYDKATKILNSTYPTTTQLKELKQDLETKKNKMGTKLRDIFIK